MEGSLGGESKESINSMHMSQMKQDKAEKAHAHSKVLKIHIASSSRKQAGNFSRRCSKLQKGRLGRMPKLCKRQSLNSSFNQSENILVQANTLRYSLPKTNCYNIRTWCNVSNYNPHKPILPLTMNQLLHCHV